MVALRFGFTGIDRLSVVALRVSVSAERSCEPAGDSVGLMSTVLVVSGLLDSGGRDNRFWCVDPPRNRAIKPDDLRSESLDLEDSEGGG